MDSNKYFLKAHSILDNVKSFSAEIPKLDEQSHKNIESLKEVNNKFKKAYLDLVEKIESIPDEIINENQKTEEVSPASIRNIVFWEWEYTNKSTKKFSREDDLFILKGTDYGSVNAYSSHVVNESFKYKIRFDDVTSFGCGGFGIISKNDPQFDTTDFGSFSGHPLFCLCCSGSWSGNNVTTKGGEAMQHRLKKAPKEERFMTFEIDIDNMKFNVYDCVDELFCEYNISGMTYKDDLVLFFYTGSSVTHSHEIVCL